jgi:glycosyltransferase involved in cell wall biosynthesis
MRVTFLSTFDYPSRYAHAIHGLEMARAFSHLHGTDFRFVCNTAVDPAELAGVPYTLLFGALGRRIKKLRLRRLLFVPVMLFRLMRERPAIIYTTEPGLYRSVIFLARFFGARVIAECHGALTKGQERALARADRQVFVTEGLRARFIARHPSLVSSSVVLPNAVDVARFDEVAEDKDALRHSLGLGDGFLVGYIGRFEPLGLDKGLKQMIDALPHLPLDVKLLLVGGAKAEVVAYEAYARERGVESRVRIVPHVDMRDVPKYAKACDVLAYVPPSNEFTETETSPMKLYEYMAAGRPMILSKTAGLSDIVHDDEASFIAPGDGRAFTAAVVAMHAAYAEACERASRAKARVASRTWDSRVMSIIQI